MKKRNGNANERYFLGAKRKWGTRSRRQNSPLRFLFFLFALSLSFSYAQQTIDITATDAVNGNELVNKSQLDAVAASVTDDQTLTLTGNTLTLENGGTVDLTPYLDNTDGQTITDFSLSGSILSLTLSGGNTQTVDLGSLGGGGSFDPIITSPQLNDIIGYNGTDFVNLPLNITAATTSYDNATSGLVATDVKAAIDELATSGGVSSKTFSPVIEVTQDTTITSSAFVNSKNFFWTDSASDIKVTVTGAGISPGEYATFSQEGEGSFQFEGDVAYGFQTIDSTSVINVMHKGTGLKPNGAWEDYNAIGIPQIVSTETAWQAESTTITVDKPSGTGNLLLLFVGIENTAGAAIKFDNVAKPPGFSLIQTGGSITADTYTAVYQKVVDGSEGANFTLTATDSGNMWAASVLVDGANETNPIGVVGAIYDDFNGSTHPLPGITTVNDNSLVLGVASMHGTDTAPYTVGNFTELLEVTGGNSATNDVGGSVSFKEMATAGSTGDCSVTLALADGASGFTFSINPL